MPIQNTSEIGGARALLSLGTQDAKSGSDPAHTDGPAVSAMEQRRSDTSVENTESPRKYNPATNFADVSNTREYEDSASPISRPDSRNDSSMPETDNRPETETGANVSHRDENQLLDNNNQSLNDAVEAAVMRYVGGTLDPEEELHTGEANSSIHGLNHDHHHEQNDENDENSENDEDDENGDGGSRKRGRIHAEDLLSEYQWDRFLEEEVAAGFDRPSPKKPRRKPFGGPDIDTELAVLGTSSEHDSLVHAAMLNVGELAKQLTLPAGQAREPGAIDHLAHVAHAAAATTTTTPSVSAGYRSENGGPTYRSLVKQADSAASATPAPPTPADPRDSAIMEPSKYPHASLEQLLQHASAEACAWYNAQADIGDRGPRLFSPEEIEIVEHFLRGYCHLHRLSRMDICRRVWTSERPKDNFWESVTKVLPYRSKASVYKHIRRQYHVFRVRAKWTPEEDEYLRKLTETTTTNWKEIGEAMGRMPEDCRDRWRNYIKCGANRVSNAWSESEELALKNIVMDMITCESAAGSGSKHRSGSGSGSQAKPLLINWTIVSERMNGVRSRIQCRYKWNKLLRRESLARVAIMPVSTKVWILGQIAASNAADIETIDWDYMVHVYHDMHRDKNKVMWTSADFKTAFEKMRGRVRDFKNLPLQQLVSKASDAIYQENAENSGGNAQIAQKPATHYEELRPKPFGRRRSAEHEAAVVANAAVAAVSSGVSASDAQQQEYTLWR